MKSEIYDVALVDVLVNRIKYGGQTKEDIVAEDHPALRMVPKCQLTSLWSLVYEKAGIKRQEQQKRS